MPLWLKASLVQLTAAGSVWTLASAAFLEGIEIPDSALVALLSLVALALSRAIKLPIWWLFIQAGFIPALDFALKSELPPALFLGGLVLLLLVFPSNTRERVPLYLSNEATWRALAELLPADRPFAMLDMGCGIGGGLRYLADRFPTARFVGVETAPLVYGLARLLLLGRSNAEVKLRNMWLESLGDYDVVYAFLSPSPMPRLWLKVREEMQPGCLFVSNSFEVSGVAPTETHVVDDPRGTRLLVWRI